MEPSIIFENDDILVIDKPAGLLVHADGRSEKVTVVDWFVRHAPQAHDVGEPQLGQDGQPLLRSGIVHRLDRETSGIMVLAKTQSAFMHLKTAFQEREAKKEYRAFVYGLMSERWGTIDRQIGRSASDFRLRSAERGARGTLRPATTDWERIVSGHYEGEPFSYLKLQPKTGRTHQLRVHLKAIGRPIVGDKLYAPSFMQRSGNLGLDRLSLHAHALTITLPDGQSNRFVAPLPAAFEAAEAKIA